MPVQSASEFTWLNDQVILISFMCIGPVCDSKDVLNEFFQSKTKVTGATILRKYLRRINQKYGHIQKKIKKERNN